MRAVTLTTPNGYTLPQLYICLTRYRFAASSSLIAGSIYYPHVFLQDTRIAFANCNLHEISTINFGLTCSVDEAREKNIVCSLYTMQDSYYMEFLNILRRVTVIFRKIDLLYEK